VAYKYAYSGPPFNFLGHFSKTQWDAFQKWVSTHTGNFPDVQFHYQMRAAQMRKTAGLLEKFYGSTPAPLAGPSAAALTNDEALTPTFLKDVWKPGPNGWFGYTFRNDHLPMVAMSGIKDYLKEPLQRQDDGVFQMNYIRSRIEKTEDSAQKMNEAQVGVQALLTKINGYFSKPEYQAALVDDQSDTYSGGPRFRVNQLDAPTQWELEQRSRTTSGGPLLKEPSQ